jgi:hypothetical protein
MDSFQTVNANFATLDGLVEDTATITISGNNITGTAVDTDINITPNGTGHIVIADDRINISTTLTPTVGIGAVGDTAGDIAWDGTNLYVCHTDYDGVTTPIWGKLALAAHT